MSNSTAFLLYNKIMASPLPQYQREYIIQLLALGNTKPEIIRKFKQRYGREIHPTTIIRLKKQNRDAINDAHEVLAVHSEVIGADLLKQKAYRGLNRKLDRAEQDDSQLELLRQQMQSGEISKSEYDSEVARYEVLTVRELTAIADSMEKHSRGNEGDTQLSPQDHAALQMLMGGINSGSPVQLMQVLNPNININPSVKTSEPPVDIPAS